jgi:Uma2 family endonuclease
MPRCYPSGVAGVPRSEPGTTLAEAIARLQQGEEIELIAGEIVPHAAPRPEHGAAQAGLAAALGPFRLREAGPRGPGGWWLMIEVEVLYGETEETFRHDALGFRRSLHPERPSGFPLAARPDWVCEILSTKTARHDLVKKQRTLHRHGIPHYWILDPEHETLTVLRWADTAYLRVQDAGLGDVVRAEPFDEITISIAEIFGREG